MIKKSATSAVTPSLAMSRIIEKGKKMRSCIRMRYLTSMRVLLSVIATVENLVSYAAGLRGGGSGRINACRFSEVKTIYAAAKPICETTIDTKINNRILFP